MSQPAAPAPGAATGTPATPAEGAPAAEGAAVGSLPAAAAPSGAAKPGEKPAEAPKTTWEQALQSDRRARAEQAKAKQAIADAQKAADEKVAAAEARATAREAEVQKLAAELAPLQEALKAKDFKKLIASFGVSMVDIAHAVADEGKPPTVEEIEARAAARAKKEIEEAQAKKDEIAAAAKKKADEEAAVQEEKSKDERFQKAVHGELARFGEELTKAENAEAYADALDADVFFGALDEGERTVRYAGGKTVTIKGGSYVARAATALMLKVLDKTTAEGKPEHLSAAQALKMIQEKVSPALQQLMERRQGRATKPQPGGQKKTGKDAQPTLSNRTTRGPVTSPKGEEGEPQLGAPMSAVEKAIARAGLQVSG